MRGVGSGKKSSKKQKIKQLNALISQLAHSNHQKKKSEAPAKTAVPPPPEQRIVCRINGTPKLKWRPDELQALSLLDSDDALGRQLMPSGAVPERDREMVLGVDFGTSATKVVLADKTFNQAYAVPFLDAAGVAAYLLPSTLYETADGVYSLAPEGKRHSDLKLDMLKDLANETACARVCAYLALVIRRARAWVFTTKRAQYLRADPLWTIAIGQPTSTADVKTLRPHFSRLAEMAWVLAGKEDPVTTEGALSIWRDRKEPTLNKDELEVEAYPEVAAQIHGFVSSAHFDPHASNNYLLIDVGAGTVDASVFHVERQVNGALGLDFFIDGVAQLGAAQLNRRRVAWWLNVMRESGAFDETKDRHLAQALEEAKTGLREMVVPNEYQGKYPRTYSDYVSGIDVQLLGGAKNPDAALFSEVVQLAQGDVLHRVGQSRKLSPDALRNIPFFLCGGGSRHPVYEALKEKLKSHRNYTWLGARYRELTAPEKLETVGVAPHDYDRLSVAYGLSQLKLGRIRRVTTTIQSNSAPSRPTSEDLYSK